MLLAAFVLMGRGLGASGAFTRPLSPGSSTLVAPGTRSRTSSSRATSATARTHPLKAWLVFEVMGVFVGALLSGLLAGRVRADGREGPARLDRASGSLCAFVGGMLMAIGAHLARGCTSGQALTGGALLNVGSWAFMMCVFGGAYAVAWFMRRQWR